MIKNIGRDREKLAVGKHIPTTGEIKRILDAAPDGYARAFLMLAAFSGLRSSEMRGLRWQDVDLNHGKLHVCQRADRYNEIGSPKSAAGDRKVPSGPMVVNTLRQWKLASKHGADDDLVFPASTGRPQ